MCSNTVAAKIRGVPTNKILLCRLQLAWSKQEKMLYWRVTKRITVASLTKYCSFSALMDAVVLQDTEAHTMKWDCNTLVQVDRWLSGFLSECFPFSLFSSETFVYVLASLQVVEDIWQEVLSFSVSSKTQTRVETYHQIGKRMNSGQKTKGVNLRFDPKSEKRIPHIKSHCNDQT